MTSLTLLSLGAGVQSTTIALMAAEGALPKPDGAIFADTGWEPVRVYRHLDRLAAVLSDVGVPLHRVSKGNLRVDSLDPAHRYASVPYHVRNPDGSQGMGRRQCTSEYKLSPIQRAVRVLLGAPPPDYRRVPRGQVAEQWIGFSTDEIHRVNDRRDVQYIRKRYPLIELGMDRKACGRWLRSRGWMDVSKSACIGCRSTATGNGGSCVTPADAATIATPMRRACGADRARPWRVDASASRLPSGMTRSRSIELSVRAAPTACL